MNLKKAFQFPDWFKYNNKLNEQTQNLHTFKTKYNCLNQFFNIININPKSQHRNIKTSSSLELHFLNFSPFSMKILFEFFPNSSNISMSTLKELLLCWYIVGKFGGYNSLNLKLLDYLNSYEVNDSHFIYDDIIISPFNKIEFLNFDLESCLIKLDIGTNDVLAMDVLINILIGYNNIQGRFIKKITIY